MEPEDSLPCVQEPATDTCSESDEFSVHSHILFIVTEVKLSRYTMHVQEGEKL
jgi:hypothetical protein